MSATAAQLLNYLNCKAQYNEYINQQIFWTRQYDNNSAKLSKYTKYEEDWENAFDDYMDPEKTCTHNGVTWAEKDSTPRYEYMAEQYADVVVEHRDEEMFLELQDRDMEYDSIKTMYDTMITKLEADLVAYKEELATSAGETELLNGGG